MIYLRENNIKCVSSKLKENCKNNIYMKIYEYINYLKIVRYKVILNDNIYY